MKLFVIPLQLIAMFGIAVIGIFVLPIFVVKGMSRHNVKDAVNDWNEVCKYMFKWIRSW